MVFVNGLEYSDSVVVAASPEALYDMVADVTRMGDWSPICKACWWEDDPGGPREGAWFGGRNVTPERTWETRSLVVAADRGREFAFQVLGDWVRWSYSFEPADGGTRVTESWQFLPAGEAGYLQRFGDEAEARLEMRKGQMREGIRATLDAIRAAAES
jgi:hypothetical protein